jgi:hypothetical protein
VNPIRLIVYAGAAYLAYKVLTDPKGLAGVSGAGSTKNPLGAVSAADRSAIASSTAAVDRGWKN